MRGIRQSRRSGQRVWLIVPLLILGCTREFDNPLKGEAGLEPLQIEAGAALVAPREIAALNAIGGDPSCYTFACVSCPSGGAVVQDTACAPTARYSAGEVGEVTDELSVTDGSGRERRVSVVVGERLSVFPARVSLAPRGTQDFMIAGGKPGLVDGRPVFEVCLLDGEGGCAAELADGTRLFHRVGGQSKFFTVALGSSGGTRLTVQAQDSLGVVAEAYIDVGDALTLVPPLATVARGEAVVFGGRGGQPPYSFTIALDGNQSGGVVDPVSGRYTAGDGLAAADTVEVTDALGARARATVHVAGVVPLSQGGGGVLLASLGSEQLSLVAGAERAKVRWGYSVSDEEPKEPAYGAHELDDWAFRIDPVEPLLEEPSPFVPRVLTSADFLQATTSREIAWSGGEFPSQLEIVEYASGVNRFQVRFSQPVDGRTEALASGDLDGDGQPELVQAGISPDSLRLFALAADGFRSTSLRSLDGAPGALAIVAHPGAAGSRAVLLGHGATLELYESDGNSLDTVWSTELDGTVVGAAEVSDASGTRWWIAVRDQQGTSLRRGAPSASAPTLVEAGRLDPVRTMTLADVNGDGRADLLALHENQPLLLLALADGSGGFGPVQTAGVDPGSSQIATADFNDDGKLDVVVNSSLGRALYFLAHDGGLGNRRKFHMPPTAALPGGVAEHRVAAVSNGASNDIALLTNQGTPALLAAGASTRVAPLQPDPTLTAAVDLAATRGHLAALRAGLRGLVHWETVTDALGPALQRSDIALAEQSDGALCMRVALLRLGDGAAALACATTAGGLVLRSPEGHELSALLAVGATMDLLRSADLNDDGTDELVALGSAEGRIRVFGVTPEDGPPATRYALTRLTTIETEVAITELLLADIDGENGADIAAVAMQGSDASTEVYFNDGTLTFGEPEVLGNAFATAAAVGDFDDDGAADLALLTANEDNSARSDLEIFAYNASFGFLSVFSETIYATASAASGADLDGDGRDDLIVFDNRASRAALLWRTGPDDFIDGTEDE